MPHALSAQIADYFGDIRFLGAGEYDDCRVVIDTVFERFHAINYLAAGEITWRIGRGRTQILHAPALFWTFPGIHYRYQRHAGATWHQFWVTFEGTRVDRLVNGGLLPVTKEGFRHIHDPGRYEIKMRELVELVQAGNRDTKYHMVHLLEELLCLSGSDTSPAQPDRIARLVDDIRRDPWKTYHFKQLATRLGMSYSNFRLRFRQRAGEGPDAFMLRCRMRAAALRLQQSGETIAEIAADLGYDNPAYFTRLFKRKMGLSPKTYRMAQPVRIA